MTARMGAGLISMHLLEARRGRAHDGGLRARTPLYQFFAILNGGH